MVWSHSRPGDLLYIARELGTQAWDVGSIPPRKLLDYARAEDEAPRGRAFFDGGVVIRSGRWIYIVDSTGGGSANIGRVTKCGTFYLLASKRLRWPSILGIEIVTSVTVSSMRVGRTDTLGRANELLQIQDRLAVADGLLGISVVNIADQRRRFWENA